MEILSIEQIRKFIPECDEIRVCPDIESCIKDNNRSCDNKDRPCYITLKKEEFEGIISLDFKNNIIIIHRLHEEEDYVRFVRPDGVDIKLAGKESKEKAKKFLDSIR